ncbi:hypothetical protein RUMTOR_01246 [[Ruminococcus] torques ATCC 27756]|uniref:Uncharacterized protein n=1 Tax=[Ruminococcus] torques ATCC 27756 TaxID=411460 RepID=A5KLZ0_9FIRM|nr:hypothetical protein RUMTOR_01246 [[Ruminococcus] torques ATCC 27756]
MTADFYKQSTKWINPESTKRHIPGLIHFVTLLI